MLIIHVHSVEDLQFNTEQILTGKGYEKVIWDYPEDVSSDEEDAEKNLNENNGDKEKVNFF